MICVPVILNKARAQRTSALFVLRRWAWRRKCILKWNQLFDYEEDVSGAEASENVDAVSVEAGSETKVTAGTRITSKSEGFKVVCYLNSWAWRRSGDYSFVPEHVVPSTCTHLIYAYAGLDSEQLVTKMNDEWTDTRYAGNFTKTL